MDVSDDEDAVAEIARTLRTVAVVGMKDAREGGAAYRIPQQMQAMGVRTIPVNPTLPSALPNLAAVGEPIDAVQIFRRSENVPAHVDEILALPPALRPRIVWMQTGIAHRESERRLSAVGIRVVMDRCLGIDMARYTEASLR